MYGLHGSGITIGVIDSGVGNEGRRNSGKVSVRCKSKSVVDLVFRFV
jgi:hypothetical protein